MKLSSDALLQYFLLFSFFVQSISCFAKAVRRSASLIDTTFSDVRGVSSPVTQIPKKPGSYPSSSAKAAEGGVNIRKKLSGKSHLRSDISTGSLLVSELGLIPVPEVSDIIRYDDIKVDSLPLPFPRFRTLDRLALSNVLIVADIEGGLHALNRENGMLIWSIEPSRFQPLIDIHEPSGVQTNETLMVEPYGDGSIYYFNVHQGLQKIPISIKQLILTSPMHLKTNIVIDNDGTMVEDEKIYTGSRRSMMYTIDLLTGEIVSVFGPGAENKCYREEPFHQGNGSARSLNRIVIGKTVYELGIHSQDGSSYNVTYAPWQHNTLDSHLARENDASREGQLVAPFRDRTLMAIDADYKIARWVASNFPGIIISAFDVFVDNSNRENVLVPHSFRDFDSYPSGGSNIYLEQTENHSWAALSSDNFPSLVREAPLSKFEMSIDWRVPSIYDDEDLLRTAITGVHKLANAQIQNFTPNLDPGLGDYSRGHARNSHADVLSVINGANNLNNELDLVDTGHNALNRYISPEELQIYRLKIQEEIAKHFLLENQHSFTHMTAHFVYRIIESGLVLLLTLVFLIILQQFKLIPPLHIIFSRIGLYPQRELKLVETQIDESHSPIEKMVNDLDTAVSAGYSAIRDNVGEGSSKGNNSNNGGESRTEFISTAASEIATNSEEIQSGSKRRKRGSRGGKKSRNKKLQGSPQLDGDTSPSEGLKNLVVTDKVLGYGSCGTIVYKGSFQGRPVAVKRMLIDFCDVAYREIKLLAESDDHPNVVRYYCSETTEKFLYIALELCNATLQDVVEMHDVSDTVIDAFKKTKEISILHQIASGVSYLHSLKIIHRDIKPQNILVSTSKVPYSGGDDNADRLRVLISDFGLCKKLEWDQSSFKTNINNPAGTTGWRAPELLRNDQVEILDSVYESSGTHPEVHSPSLNGNSVVSSGSYYDPIMKKRLTKAIDVFSMGCVFFYVLTRGGHPFGDKYMREANIVKGEYDMSPLKSLGKERSMVAEACDLIPQMIANDPSKRPAAATVLKHPFFWPKFQKLNFLLKVSDRLEAEKRDPISHLLVELEKSAHTIIGNNDWSSRMDRSFMDNLGKYRKYHFDRVMDLLRALRNKYHHFMDLPEELADVMGSPPDGFYDYFNRRFPNLLIEVYRFVRNNLKDDQMLGEFF